MQTTEKRLIKSSNPKTIFSLLFPLYVAICSKYLWSFYFVFSSFNISVWQILLFFSHIFCYLNSFKSFKRRNKLRHHLLSCLPIIISFNTNNWLSSAFPLCWNMQNIDSIVCVHEARYIYARRLGCGLKAYTKSIKFIFLCRVHAIHKSWAFSALKVFKPWPQSLQPRAE